MAKKIINTLIVFFGVLLLLTITVMVIVGIMGLLDMMTVTEEIFTIMIGVLFVFIIILTALVNLSKINQPINKKERT